jgi:hypothetical protein
MTEHARKLVILVVGAGQAGLALGFQLKKTPFRFQLVERHAQVGDSWRKRYASLVLFTSRAYSALPGLAVPGDPDGFPTKDEMGDYFLHQRGISPVPNLYFIGRSWQWTRGSALFAGVGEDAAYLTEHFVKHLDHRVVA